MIRSEDCGQSQQWSPSTNLWCYAVFLQGPPLRMLSVTRDMAVVVVAGPDHAVVDTTTVEIDTKYIVVVFC